MTEHLVPLVRSMIELVSNGRLAGPFQDYCIVTPENGVAAWRELATAQPVAPLAGAAAHPKVIVFDVNERARTLLRELAAERPAGDVISFFTEYLPCILTRTFAPLACNRSDPIGRGLVLFHMPRTGSHYLQSMISDLALFGQMEDWIRPPVIEAVRRQVIDLGQHLERCARYQRHAAEHWCTRVEIPFLREVWPLLSEEEQRAVIAFFGNAHCVTLNRRNRAAQTWSMIKAATSSQWMVPQEAEAQSAAARLETSEERLWFWLLSNVEAVREGESFLGEFADTYGLEIPTIWYEDIDQPEIPAEAQQAVLGDFFAIDGVLLDPQKATYRRQATDKDQPYVAFMEGMLAGTQTIDLRNRRDMNACETWLQSGSARFRPDGVHLHGVEGGLVFDVGHWPKRGTCAVHFRVKDDALAMPTVSLWCGDDQLSEFAVPGAGIYVLMADATVVQGPLAFRAAEIGPTNNPGEPWPLAVRKLVRVEVPFEVKPYFPWISEVGNSDACRLYRFT